MLVKLLRSIDPSIFIVYAIVNCEKQIPIIFHNLYLVCTHINLLLISVLCSILAVRSQQLYLYQWFQCRYIHTLTNLESLNIFSNRLAKQSATTNEKRFFTTKSEWTRVRNGSYFLTKPRTFYSRRNNSKVDSIEKRRTVITH